MDNIFVWITKITRGFPPLLNFFPLFWGCNNDYFQDQLIFRLFSWFIVLSIKCSHKQSSDVLFCLTKVQKFQAIHFTIAYYKENIKFSHFTSRNEQMFVCFFFLKKCRQKKALLRTVLGIVKQLSVAYYRHVSFFINSCECNGWFSCVQCRLSKELQQKDKIIESLHTKLQQRPETPSSCHALSETTDHSDRTSLVSDEYRTNEDLELCSDLDAREYQEEHRLRQQGHGSEQDGIVKVHSYVHLSCLWDAASSILSLSIPLL